MGLFGSGSKTVKMQYKLAIPYHPGMDRAIDQIYSTKGIKGVVFEGLSAVEIEYDPSRLTTADVDRLLDAGLDARRKS
jgi:L-asparaginase/Glu-tRNA(Gln) amidotransferase subunit D